MKKIPSKLQRTTTEVRELLVKKFYKIFYQAQKVTINPVFEAGQKLRHFVMTVKKLTNVDKAKYIQQWIRYIRESKQYRGDQESVRLRNIFRGF